MILFADTNKPFIIHVYFIFFMNISLPVFIYIFELFIYISLLCWRCLGTLITLHGAHSGVVGAGNYMRRPYSLCIGWSGRLLHDPMKRGITQ